jgi:hypothetical protein
VQAFVLLEVAQDHHNRLLDRHIHLVGLRTLSSECRLEEAVVELDCTLQVPVVVDLLDLDQKDSVGCSYSIARES